MSQRGGRGRRDSDDNLWGDDRASARKHKSSKGKKKAKTEPAQTTETLTARYVVWAAGEFQYPRSGAGSITGADHGYGETSGTLLILVNLAIIPAGVMLMLADMKRRALEEEERWMREIERKLADGHMLSEEELQLVARFAEEQELEDA